MSRAASSAIILAGGLGTRLRSVVPELPKPMAGVAGRPFLEHQLDYWIGQGIRRFVLSVGYQHEAIVNHFGDAYNGAVLDYVVEAEPLGTGGGLLLAVDRLGGDEPFLVLNGDTYFAVDLAALDAFADARDADWCISLFRAEEAGRYQEVSVAADGRVTSLAAHSAALGRLASGGVYRVHPRAVEGRFGRHVRVSLETDILPAALASGQRVFGLECPGPFIDIGVPADFERAQTVLARAQRAVS